MLRSHRPALTAGCAIAIAALTLTGIPALAAIPAAGPGPTAGARTGVPTEVPAEMLDSMRRDLGLTAEEAKARITNEYRAGTAAPALRRSLGTAFGGAWVTGKTAELTVATTDQARHGTITAAGAKAVTVSHSLDDLTTAKAALDRTAERRAPAAVAASVWYVDVKSNSVVVQSADPAKASDFVAASGVERDVVRIVESAEEPHPLYDVRGGEAYYINGTARCSIGFSVTKDAQGGFVTAGHCGQAGATTTGVNRVAQGTFQGSRFPGNDYAWVAVSDEWAPGPVVLGPGGAAVTVAGSQQAPVGSSVCRSGSTTGWHCGTIEQLDTSVRYTEGLVSGLSRTTVCAEPGDSGGSYISGSQAQGITSGGSGNCTAGGTTYFQPVNPILEAYGLALKTG
ncbi:S1 family peptidase [Streptomyces cuspidosporus]|uniref:Alpha-lytic protease prodomain-containing protein n=1 Tax=Streptomyces cuspidosporus TaxID=66882 RepID=A0ABP5TIF6_9ACTN